MAELTPVAEARRPTVRIITCNASERDLLPILWGLEEEGIPAEVQDVSSGEAITLAKQAAHSSSLNVGIALSGVEGLIVLHHRDLSGECPLFTLATKDAQYVQLRLMGTNAARLVKLEPLVFQVDVVSDSAPPESRILTDSNETLDLIVRTVLELLAKG